MREPWDIVNQFVGNLQQQTANSRNVADTALMRMMAANVARGDAATQQGYSLDTLARRNDYSTQADTTAFGRQLVRDQNAFTQQDRMLEKRRGFDINDREYNTGQRRDEAILNAKLQSEREAAQGLYPGFNARRYVQSTVSRESGGDPNAKNPNSSARGRYQFLDGTRDAVLKAHPELMSIADPTLREDAMFKAFTQDNQKVLAANGIPITNGTTYAAHFLGAGGAARALRQPDGTPMEAVVDPQVIAANPHLRGMTVGSFKQWTEQQHGGDAAPSTQDAGMRRYTDGDGGYNPTTEILGLPVGNSVRQDLTQPSDPIKAYAESRGLEIVRPFMATEAQLDLLPPELKENIIPDPYANAPSNKRAPSVYYEVRPRANDGATAAPGVAPKPAMTQAAPVELKESRRARYSDGKLVLDDGTDVQLPD